MKDVHVRACTRQDLESVAQLDNLWNEEGVAYVWYGDRAEIIADFERFPQYFLVAENGDRIVGYVNGSVRANDTVEVFPKTERYLEVQNIYVMPEFRAMHVGGDLLEGLLGVAKENGIERFLVSTVTKDMDSILRFYRSHGFTPWYVELFK
jgi:ribosomal protein S18 acetylase RimI-like enzyme